MISLAEVVDRIRGRHGADLARVRFETFRHLLEMDNRVLSLIGDANEKLAGAYLFDTQYLRWLEEELAGATTAVVQDLADISGNRYPALLAARDRVRDAVRAALDLHANPGEGPPVIGFDDVGCEAAESVGEKMARLCELRNHLGLRVPDGFIVRASASRLLLDDPQAAGAITALADGAPVTDDAQEIVRTLPVPPEVDKALRRALARFDRDARFAVRSSAVGEDGAVSFAGQHDTRLNVARDEVPDAWRDVVASLFSPRALEYRRAHGLQVADAAMGVGCLLMTPAVASGVTYTVDPADPDGLEVVVAATLGLGEALVGGDVTPDRFTLSRGRPHRVLTRAVAPKRTMRVAAAGGGTHSVPVPADVGDRPSLSDEQLGVVTCVSLQIERHMRGPQDIEWAIDADGRLTLMQARPLAVEPRRPLRGEALGEAVARYRVLMRGQGEVACRGVGSGRVRVVGPDGQAEGFEAGDVVVARYASPRLSALAASASAVVTDVGAVTGHMATVAREYRVPTIVGCGEATRRLEPGTVVTVDADGHAIYEGAVHELLRYQLLEARPYQEIPQFRALRNVLALVAPLTLGDPDEPGFAPERCRTYHDIVRFAHERALEELSRIGASRLRRRGRSACRLNLEVPLDLCVVDIGGGVADVPPSGTIGPERVTSAPLSLLLEGLLTPGVWATRPADMDLDGFMASATRGVALTSPATSTVTRNVAVVSHDYLNLSLKVGYHFNVVDAYLGDGPDTSRIVFRFVGGVTDLVRRTRRARLLAGILERHDFETDQRGELIIGRLEGMTRPFIEDRLRMVGRLIGYARQLDILLRDDEIVDTLIDRFMRGRYEPGFDGAAEEPSMADKVQVMVVDDEPTVCERLKDYLEKQGMAVETYLDSQTAVARLAERRFHVVVTDLKMKGATGLDVLGAIKQRALPTEVVIITGFRTFEDARGAELMGAFGFVDKPFHLEEIGDMVRKAAKRAPK